MFSMQCRKNITVFVKTNFVNIYVQIYISILHMTKVTRNKNDSINSRY